MKVKEFNIVEPRGYKPVFCGHCRQEQGCTVNVNAEGVVRITKPEGTFDCDSCGNRNRATGLYAYSTESYSDFEDACASGGEYFISAQYSLEIARLARRAADVVNGSNVLQFATVTSEGKFRDNVYAYIKKDFK